MISILQATENAASKQVKLHERNPDEMRAKSCLVWTAAKSCLVWTAAKTCPNIGTPLVDAC